MSFQIAQYPPNNSETISISESRPSVAGNGTRARHRSETLFHHPLEIRRTLPDAHATTAMRVKPNDDKEFYRSIGATNNEIRDIRNLSARLARRDATPTAQREAYFRVLCYDGRTLTSLAPSTFDYYRRTVERRIRSSMIAHDRLRESVSRPGSS